MLGLLPGGFVDQRGTVHNEIELRALTGREEELLGDSRRRESASLVTALLGRCVERIGALRPVGEDVARALLIADRQYALLKLREATFGDQVRASVPCPWPDCGKRVAISFSINDIPVEVAADKGPTYAATLSPEAMAGLDEPERTVVFRLPNGGDQEVLSPLLADNEPRALTELLGRCLLRIGRDTRPDAEAVARLSPRARLEIEAHMDRVAPHVDLLMDATCVECGREFSLPFDLQRFFFGELRTSGDLLYREVHYLAFHYHWGEREIMEMTRERRRRYIDVLADEIERLNESV
jgi:hypothetical protein